MLQCHLFWSLLAFEVCSLRLLLEGISKDCLRTHSLEESIFCISGKNPLNSIATKRTNLNQLFVVYTKEKWDAEPLLTSSVYHSMYGALVESIGPAHHEIGNVNN